MFRIGDFSRIARVSCRLLRHYDELGLLKPVRVDGSTGYRYYGAAQLPSLHRILVLKELGLSLEQIRPIVEGNVSVAELRGMLLMRRAQAEQAMSAEADRPVRRAARLLSGRAGARSIPQASGTRADERRDRRDAVPAGKRGYLMRSIRAPRADSFFSSAS